jgi:hypothetical protein
MYYKTKQHTHAWLANAPQQLRQLDVHGTSLCRDELQKKHPGHQNLHSLFQRPHQGIAVKVAALLPLILC